MIKISGGNKNAKRLPSSEYSRKRSRSFQKTFVNGFTNHRTIGGKILARGPHADRHEGNVAGVVTMLEFESKEAAETFYFSDDYQGAKAIRDTGCDTDLMIIEGL